MIAKVIETNEIIYDAVEYHFDYAVHKVKGRNDKGEYVEYDAWEVIMLPSEMQEKSIDWEQRRYEAALKMFPETLKVYKNDESAAEYAVRLADILIAELKK